MKNFVIAILLLITVLPGWAQITITSADAPSVGMVIYQANDSTPSAAVLPGNAGANQTWNLSALNFIYYDTMHFVTPASTPYAAQFPGTNLAVKLWLNGNPAYYYIFKDNTGVFAKGLHGNPSLALNQVIDVKFTPSMSMMRFPTNYQSSFTENYHYYIQALSPPSLSSLGDSMRLHSWITSTNTTDGWGTVTTPGGTFNVLRQFVRDTNKDTIWVKNSFLGWIQVTTSKDTADTYRWTANGIGITVAEMKMNRAQNKAKSVTWYVSDPLSVKNTSASAMLYVFPNPSSDLVYINNLDENLDYTISVFDLLGKEVENIQSKGNTKREISLNKFHNGIYFISVSNNGRKIITEKILINK